MSGIDIRNGNTRLRLEGGGGENPILFLHGLTFDSWTYSGLIERLPDAFEWWTTDLRGHGKSAWTAPPYLYRDLIEDTATVIQDGIGKPVYLFGHSLGGAVALAVAARAPGWVRGLIVSDNFLTRKSYAAAIQQPLVQTLLKGLSKLARQELDAEGTARALADLKLPGPNAQEIPLREFPGNSPEFLFLWAKALTRCDPEAALLTLEEVNLTAFEGESYLERLQCPLLLLQADTALGGMLPAEDVEIARRIKPDLEVQSFPGTGHFMHLHDPGPTAAALTRFIRGRPRHRPLDTTPGWKKN